jgi:hypothetical protein
VSRISPAPRSTTLREFDGVDAGRHAAAMGEDLPARSASPGADLLGVDGDDDALVAELVGCLGDEFRALTAAELIETLSAPASSNLRTSSTVRTPPPTVSGMKQCSAVRATTSKIVSRLSEDAVMSRKQSSSARRVIGLGSLDRIAGIDQVDEIDALDDAAVLARRDRG